MKNFVELVPLERVVEEELVWDRIYKKPTIFSFNKEDYGILEEVAREHTIEDYLLFVKI